MISVQDLAALLRVSNWTDDHDKTKQAAHVLRVFDVVPRVLPREHFAAPNEALNPFDTPPVVEEQLAPDGPPEAEAKPKEKKKAEKKAGG